MNVLGKVVIPRCKASVRYILDSLEELEREEFFRLKKILEVKYRNKNKLERKTETDAKEIDDTIKCKICGAIIPPPPPPPKTDEEIRIEVYLEQLEELLVETKKLEEESVVQAGFKEFMITAKDLKFKIDQCKTLIAARNQANLIDGFCDKCRERNKTSTSRSELHSILSAESIELGIFETEIEEITQIVRTRKPDGSIKEERREITIKKETRPLTSQVKVNKKESGRPGTNSSVNSKGSNIYSNQTTIRIATIDNDTYQPKIPERVIKSEIIKSSPAMVVPTTRSCISSSNLYELSKVYSEEICNFWYKKVSSSNFHNMLLMCPMFKETLIDS